MGRCNGRLLGALVLVSVLALSACGSNDDSTESSGSGALDAAAEAKVKDIVRRFQDTNRTPGVLVGIWSPKGTFVSATGVADLATEAPLRSDMQFKIASQTKTFTANLVLQLVGEGKVALDEHISKWVKGVPNGDRITIRQLLNHTSGLADGFTSPTVQSKVQTGCTVAELLTAEAKFPPSRLPAPSGPTATTVTTCSAGSWSWPAARI
ncbi:serine hydrolase domain-containing protein [Streptomyces sp. MS1.AVA.1]|uniref:Serine hydrolase domain-containing protein n=1 Tax=Streptomyces machairae TaxID=3134109 RepID=A0ABU8UVN7_9ACTN